MMIDRPDHKQDINFLKALLLNYMRDTSFPTSDASCHQIPSH